MTLLALTLLAVAIFAATNIDDMVLLIGLYSDPSFGTRRIVEGQILGIAILYAISAAAAFAAVLLPGRYLALLGIAPLTIGIFKLRDQWTGRGGEPQPTSLEAARKRALAVALLTVANGGDNVATYTPVFAVHSPAGVAYMGAVFLVMTLLWCGLARRVVAHPRFGRALRLYGSRGLPYVLIGLGILIFAKGNAAAVLP